MLVLASLGQLLFALKIYRCQIKVTIEMIEKIFLNYLNIIISEFVIVIFNIWIWTSWRDTSTFALISRDTVFVMAATLAACLVLNHKFLVCPNLGVRVARWRRVAIISKHSCLFINNLYYLINWQFIFNYLLCL